MRGYEINCNMELLEQMQIVDFSRISIGKGFFKACRQDGKGDKGEMRVNNQSKQFIILIFSAIKAFNWFYQIFIFTQGIAIIIIQKGIAEIKVNAFLD